MNHRATAIAMTLLACALPASAQDLSHWYEVAGGQWTVPAETLAEAAGHVQDAADKAPWSGMPRTVGNYRVQYQGELKEGKKLVHLMGACKSFEGQTDMTSHWLIVMDGGSCYYDAEYDPASHTFVYFAFHGVA